MKNLVKNIFQKEIEFIKNIHLEEETKAKDLITTDIVEYSYDSLKLVTSIIMKKTERSDTVFLLWLHFIGNYIKLNFEGKWILLRRRLGEITYLVPCVIGADNEFWLVGEFCQNYYYNKNQMYGISFETFYKLEIERVIWKPKFEELNLLESDLVLLED